MTTDMLEQSYNVRAVVPDYLDIFADWEARSRQARNRLSPLLDCAYGPGKRETLDLYSAGAGTPLLVYVHGGYWQWNDKAMFGFLAEPLVAAGISVAIINYPLAPTVGVPEIIPSVRRAVAQAWHLGQQHGLDGDRLFVAGHSAGGHLASWMLATDWAAVDPALPPDPIQGVVAISGIFDLRPLLMISLNEGLRLTADSAVETSPLLAAPVTLAAPLVVAWGEAETLAFISQSRNFAATWGALGLPVTRLPLPDRNHFTVLEDLADPGGALAVAVRTLCLTGQPEPSSPSA